jgi:hypothetical protein
MAVPAVLNGAACKARQADGIGSPIAKIVMADGHEKFIYEPIPGLEHLFREPRITGAAKSHTLGRAQSVPLTTSNLLIQAGMPRHAPKRSQSTAVGTLTNRSAPLKRRRSSVRQRDLEPLDGKDEDGEEDESREVVKGKSNTFYIGDIEGLQRFMRQRFNELTMKPLRGIITNWIRLLEPRRLGEYGKYHEMLPSQMPEDATPPWWPKTIIYKEPSHLRKDGMSLV